MYLSPGHLDADNTNYPGHILDGLSDPDDFFCPMMLRLLTILTFNISHKHCKRHSVKLESEMEDKA